jgi:hypothetical protein
MEMTAVKDEKHRPFWHALVFEKDGDMNLTWLFVLALGAAGSLGFLWVTVLAPFFGFPASAVVQIAAWSFLAGAFASVLIAAIPIAKAKVLAKATLPGELAKSVASVGDTFVEQSTDLQEGKTKGTEEVG